MPLPQKLKIRILKGFEAELWQANRRKVLKDYDKGRKIEGIKEFYRLHFYTIAYANPNK